MNTEQIRSCFPALDRMHGGRRVAYFDGPGGTQVPRQVVRAVGDYLEHHNANTHWNYPTSNETDQLLAAARDTFAAFVNCRPSEVVFGANMTTLTFHLARSLGRGFEPGDEIVISELDHHGNVGPWQALARERGIVLRSIPLDPRTGQLRFDALDRMITPRCRLLAIGAASNALGTVTDLRAVMAAARSVGALIFVDAVHYAPHFLVDVQALACDFLACSAYKFYGPHVGMLFVKQPLLDALDVPRLEPAPDIGPERLETGTINHEGVVGSAAAVEFLASLGAGPSLRARLSSAYTMLHERAQQQITRLWHGLAALEGVRCFGPDASARRTPTIGFVIAGVPSDQVATRLAARGIFVSHGDFYAQTVIERLGLQPQGGLVRAGCACYTSDEEIEALLNGVAEIASTRS